jgi:predicted CoA-binding protein
MARLSDIQEFLSHKRIAVIGVSRNPKDFTRVLYDEFVRRGYDVVAVNPAAAEIGGRRCFANIAEVKPSPEVVLLMTPVKARDAVIRECVAAGIGRVWTYGTGGGKTLAAETLAVCKQSGMTIVEGECPFMFLPSAGGVHRFHGFVRKVFRSYPA